MREAVLPSHSHPIAGVRQAVICGVGTAIDRYQRHIRETGGEPHTSEVVRRVLHQYGILPAVATFMRFEAQRYLPDDVPDGTLKNSVRRVLYQCQGVALSTVEGTLLTVSPRMSKTVAHLQKNVQAYGRPRRTSEDIVEEALEGADEKSRQEKGQRQKRKDDDLGGAVREKLHPGEQ